MPSRLIGALPSGPATRALIYCTLAGSSGRALFITVSVIFFTRSVGLTAAEVGLGLTLAALVALFVGVPAGHVADRVGPRTVGMVVLGVRAVATLGYLMVSGFWGFLAVATALAMLEAAGSAAQGAVIAGVVPGENRVRVRAILRSVTNIGWAVGAVGAAAALHFDTRGGYVTVLLACVASGILAAGLLLRVPDVAGKPNSKDVRRLQVLRDRPYVSLTVLNGILCIHYGMLNVAVPLWVVQRTHAPAWVVGMLALLNAVAVILFQVRASRSVTDAVSAAVAQRLAGFLLAGACVLYALAEGPPLWIATGVLVAAAAVHAMGELRQAAGSWGIAFDLAPDHAQGQYQGMYNTGWSLAGIIAPAVLTIVVIDWPGPGWIVFAAVFAATGAAVPVALRWAQRSRLAAQARDSLAVATDQTLAPPAAPPAGAGG